MRRRTNSGSKAHSNTNSNTDSNHPTTIEMTRSMSTPSPLKRRTHTEMERGSFSMAIVAAAEKVASSIDFDRVCNSSTNSNTNMSINTSIKTKNTSFDMDDDNDADAPKGSNSSTSSSEDEEKQPLLLSPQHLGERQSLLQQNQEQEQNYQRSQIHLQEQQQQQRQSSGSSSFPHIDMSHLNLNGMNLNLNNLNLNGMNLNLNNLNLNNLNLNNLNLNNLNISMNSLNMHLNIENFDFDHLPTEIQMALEDTLLGWTHLTSIAIGHILLPFLVFYTVQRASQYVLETTVYTLNTYSQMNGNKNINTGNTASHNSEGDLGNSVEAVLVSPTTHFLLGAVAAIAAFRVIRNRRKVWFRHAYGSKAYNTCEEGRRRREAVLETDKRHASLLSLSSNANAPSSPTWTSQVFSNYKRKRHKKKLRQASDRFERHHTGLSPTSRSNSTTKSRLNNRRQKFWKDDYDSTSIAPTEDDYDSSSSSSSSDGNEPEHANRGTTGGVVEPSTTHSALDGVHNGGGNGTCPNRSSIAHDAVSIPRIHNVPYAHGGFFGAAPFFLADKRWVTILRELLPDVYVEISRRVGTSYYYSKLWNMASNIDYRPNASKLIHWAENNPVVAAYGVAMDLQIKQELNHSHTTNNSTPKTTAPATTPTHSNATPEEFNTASESNSTPPRSNCNSNSDSNSGNAPSGNIIDHFYQRAGHDHKIEIEETKQQPEEESESQPLVIPNLEWDIFVDPQLVRRVEAVLNAMDRYVASKDTTKNSANNDSNGNSDDSTAKEFEHAASVKVVHGTEPSEPGCDTCAFFNNENGTANKIGADDEDEDNGNSEAAALLADHDYNSIINNPIDIDNLCGSNPSNICTDCFHTTDGTMANRTMNQFSSDFFADGGGEDRYLDHHQHHHHLSHDPVLRYLERELERRTQELTDRLLIAHGNVLQLIMEQAGYLKDWNYSRVQRTRRTLGGGMYARQWMAVFAEALRLGMKKPQNRQKSSKKRGKSNHRSSSSSSTNSSNNNPWKGNSTDNNNNSSPHRNKSSESLTTHNFYDDEEGDSEINDLLPVEEDSCGDDCGCDSEDDDGDDLLEKDRYDLLEDDHNHHCTCSPRCCLDTTMAESLKLIERITRTKQPVGILLDLKSRHVPKRVLSLMVRSLQAAGIRVVGIASFEISDIRGVCSHPHTVPSLSPHPSPTPIPKPPPLAAATKEILMVHSAGDLQAACDEGLVHPGDHVFFNGGSLILDSARSSTLKSLLGFFFDMCVCGYINTFDPCVIEDGYKIQSYGYACSGMDAMETAGNFVNETRNLIDTISSNPQRRKSKAVAEEMKQHDDEDTILLMSPSSSSMDEDNTEMGAVMKTLADYKKHYGFSMGLYLQEFSIDEAAARLLIDLVNQNPQLYDLGLAWGGINGMTVHGIQPGRFTSTDGYWNQRRLGKLWRDPF